MQVRVQVLAKFYLQNLKNISLSHNFLEYLLITGDLEFKKLKQTLLYLPNLLVGTKY